VKWLFRSEKWRARVRRLALWLTVLGLVMWMVAAPQVAFRTSLAVVQLWWESMVPVVFPALVAGCFLLHSGLFASLQRFAPRLSLYVQAMAVGTVGCGLLVRQCAQRNGWSDAQFQLAISRLYLHNPLFLLMLAQAQPHPLTAMQTATFMFSYYAAFSALLALQLRKPNRQSAHLQAPHSGTPVTSLGEQLATAVRQAAELSLWYGCACLTVQIGFAALAPLHIWLDPFVAKQQVAGAYFLLACTWGGFSSHLMLFLQTAGRAWLYRRFVSVRLQHMLLATILYLPVTSLSERFA
jgi:hypothetical protein